METKKHIIIALILVLFATTAGISEEFRISDTRQASCIIKITLNTDITPLSLGDIDNIIHSSSVMGKAAREMLDTTPATVIFLPGSEISGQGKGNQMTYSWYLNIELPESIKPAANEFVKAIADNLQISLDNIYTEYFNEYIDHLNSAQKQYDEAKDKLNELREQPRLRIIPVGPKNHIERTFIHEQLEEKVDLSDITPETTFGEIIDRLRNSVEPPLQIQPNWRDLIDMADIDRETLCEMEPLTGVKLGKALDVLLEGLSIANTIELDYIIDDGVITIATTDTLPNNMVTCLYDISGLVNSSGDADSIAQAIRDTIEPESWYDPDKIDTENIVNNSITTGGYGGSFNVAQNVINQGDGKIAIMQGNKLSIYNTPEIHDKITELLANFPTDFPDESVANIPVEMLQEDKQDLERQRRQIEMEVARLEARQSTAEQQIIAVSNKVKSDTNVNDLKIKLTLLLSELEVLKNTRTEQHPEVKAVQNKIDEIKVKISSIEVDSVSVELKRLIENQTTQLERMKEQHEALVANKYASPGPSSEMIEAEEKLARLKIELARRLEELARPAGIGSLSTINENLSIVILDLAEKKAELKVVNKQLSEIEGRIRAASTTDPDMLRIRQEKQALDRAAKRLNELKIIEENLQPPKVIVIGAN